MAVHPNSLKALEENRKNTQFGGELAVEYQKRSCEKKRQKKQTQKNPSFRIIRRSRREKDQKNGLGQEQEK